MRLSLPTVRALRLLAPLLLAACGGGGGGAGGPPPPPPPPPPSSFSYASPQFYVVDKPITPLTPTGTAGLSNFTLALPMEPLRPGLTLDPNTGVISGTPTSVGQNTYTIRASAAGGQAANATVEIIVSPVARNTISYGSAAFGFTANVPAGKLSPATASGETVSGWSITPQLPAGFTFNASNGTISGTPTGVSPATQYTVRAQNSAGPLSVSFTIQVESTVLVNLGHGSGIIFLQFNGSTLLSVDANGHWVLWSYSNGTMLAAGESACPYSGCSVPNPVGALAGATAVIKTQSGFQVLSASTGTSLGTINTSASWWSLAEDGSYLVTGSSAALTAWSPAGQVLLSRPGNYSVAVPFASPGAIRIAMGPAGSNVIETVTVPGGGDSVSATFNGTFSSWFLDGSAFFSGVSGTTLIYSNAAVQEAAFAASASALSGMGSWLWSGALNIYALSAPTTVVASYSFANFYGSVVASASTLGVINTSTDMVSVIDLSGAAPSKVDYTLPIGAPDAGSSVRNYAAASASRWIVGSDYGVLLDGASLSGKPRFFGYGQVLSLAGNGSQIAVGTASGTILYFNALTLAQEGTIQFTSDALALSPDGSILAAGPSQVNGVAVAAPALNIYSLPAGSLLHSWLYPAPSSSVPMISLAGTGPGTVLGQTFGNSTCTILISAPTGGTPSFCSSTDALLDLSSDATVFATSSTVDPNVAGVPFSPYGTNLYQDDTLVTAIVGWPVGWIGSTQLIVNNYQPDALVSEQANYFGCALYSPTGMNVGSCELPGVLAFQTVDSESIYAKNLNEILSPTTGLVSWASGNPVAPAFYPQVLNFLDALAGNHVVFASGAYVVAQSH